jgi:hypothetical protein
MWMQTLETAIKTAHNDLQPIKLHVELVMGRSLGKQSIQEWGCYRLSGFRPRQSTLAVCHALTRHVARLPSAAKWQLALATQSDRRLALFSHTVQISQLRERALTSRRILSSGMLRRVALVRTDVSEELSVSIIRVTRIGELGTTLAVINNRHTLGRNTTWRS